VTVTLLVDTYGGGTASIYTGTASDESAHQTPLSNLSRLKFHSGLSYPKIIDEWSDDVTFPARVVAGVAAAATTVASQTLFAHGLSGFPWVLASVEIGGVNVPFCGSVPVQVGDGDGGAEERPWARWVSIGADATNVYCFEYTVVDRDPGTGASTTAMPEVTLPITVWVTDKILE
jgi:hypothetical protein